MFGRTEIKCTKSSNELLGTISSTLNTNLCVYQGNSLMWYVYFSVRLPRNPWCQDPDPNVTSSLSCNNINLIHSRRIPLSATRVHSTSSCWAIVCFSSTGWIPNHTLVARACPVCLVCPFTSPCAMPPQLRLRSLSQSPAPISPATHSSRPPSST